MREKICRSYATAVAFTIMRPSGLTTSGLNQTRKAGSTNNIGFPLSNTVKWHVLSIKEVPMIGRKVAMTFKAINGMLQIISAGCLSQWWKFTVEPPDKLVKNDLYRPPSAKLNVYRNTLRYPAWCPNLEWSTCKTCAQYVEMYKWNYLKMYFSLKKIVHVNNCACFLSTCFNYVFKLVFNCVTILIVLNCFILLSVCIIYIILFFYILTFTNHMVSGDITL